MKKYKKKTISKIILDGEEHVLSGDKKHLKGPKKEYTVEEFRKAKGEKAKFLIVPPAEVAEGSVFSFTTKEKYESWLAKQNLLEAHKKDKEMDKWVRGKKSPAEDEEFIRQQNEKIKTATEKFETFLQKHNLKSDDIDKLQDKLIELGPDHNQHSLYLYDGTWWTGRGIVIPGGRWWWFWVYPNCVPDLSQIPWFFDNIASSLATWGSDHARLYSEKWYGGIELTVYAAIGDLDVFFGIHFGNVISSVKVY